MFRSSTVLLNSHDKKSARLMAPDSKANSATAATAATT
jgi:hypothetical protein